MVQERSVTIQIDICRVEIWRCDQPMDEATNQGWKNSCIVLCSSLGRPWGPRDSRATKTDVNSDVTGLRYSSFHPFRYYLGYLWYCLIYSIWWCSSSTECLVLARCDVSVIGGTNWQSPDTDSRVAVGSHQLCPQKPTTIQINQPTNQTTTIGLNQLTNQTWSLPSVV